MTHATHYSKLKLTLIELYAVVSLLGFLLLPGVAHASVNTAAVWIPWWAEESGTKSALTHIRDIDEIHPFVFTVQADGSLKNNVDFADVHWEALFNKAARRHVDIIPTVAWFDGEEINTVLSDKTTRKKHIDALVSMVKKYHFDGVEIDYESKLAETIDEYSLFLKELDNALGSKDLVCTVEARTPPEDRWHEVPSAPTYANDYEEINDSCDRIVIMAYDQQRIDLSLNDERRGVPYMPVADSDWVEKVLELALDDFDHDKVMLGIPTYGRAWDVTVVADWYKDYTAVASLNQPRILELAKKYEVSIGRTEGGEAVFTYFPDDSRWTLLNQLPTPVGTPVGYEAAAKAFLVATYANIEIPVRMIVWSDAAAVKAKLDLAKKYKLKGTALFKIDGEEDSTIWKLY